MPFVGDTPYLTGCTCENCLKIKNSLEQFYTKKYELLAEMNLPTPVAKPWSEFANPPELYPNPTYNQYQVYDPGSEFYQKTIGPSYLSYVEPKNPSQEEINAIWRPWFDALSLTQRKIVEKSFPTSLPVSGEFPEYRPEGFWKGIKAHLDSPYNHVMYMISQMPVFNAEVVLPCGGSCGSLDRAYLFSAVMHMNDIHEWSFNQIADWLDTLGLDLSFPIPEEITEH